VNSSVFERNGSDVHPYVRSDGTFVRGHKRQGGWVSSHKYQQRIELTGELLRSPGTLLLFATKCQCCATKIFVYRDKTTGCVVYDSLETPWAVHCCWKRFPGVVLKGVSEDLVKINYNGSYYRQDLGQFKRLSKRNWQTVGGFVYTQSRLCQFASYDRSATSTFRMLVFIPTDCPGRYLEVLVPTSWENEFAAHTIHNLKVRYAKFQGLWRCFAEATTWLVPGSAEPQQERPILNLEDRCVWCGKTGVLSGRWGFDTEHRVECSDCGSRRRDLRRDAFEKKIAVWSRQLRRR
jgi:hypothetical protein